MNTTFFNQGIRVVKITDWLNWATRMETTDDQWAVVLPMIQRGSVWKPHQVIDLWDTIFRGMPFGGLMASHMPAASGLKFFHPLTRKLVDLPANGGLSLIDGQQRTLAMLMAWPAVNQQMQRRIWVDFGEDDTYDHLLRLHFTSESSPMGYQRNGPSGQAIGRLSLAERRLANATYADRMAALGVVETTTLKLRYLHDAEISPWHSTFPLDLRFLITEFQPGVQTLHTYVATQADDAMKKIDARIALVKTKQVPFDTYDDALRESIISHLQKRMTAIEKCMAGGELTRRIDTLVRGLDNMAKQHFPVIEVPEHLMSAQEADEKKDPPLAVLFKRIGTGGTDLKTSDYVFSVLKHLNPGCHSLVEIQLEEPRIAAIYTPTDLVMSAVRLTAAQLEPLKDQPKLDKAQFTRLLRGEKSASVQDPQNSHFFVAFNKNIAADGAFVKNLQALLKEIEYRPSDASHAVLDIGLPLHALSLVHIPALEVILFWLQKSKLPLTNILSDNRHALIRFLLCWHLTVPDDIKASKECFKYLSADTSAQFPEAALFNHLVVQDLALPMRSPQALLQQQVLPIRVPNKEAHSAMLVFSSESVNGLRGWRRFVAHTDASIGEQERDDQKKTVKLYERWWNLRGGYSHALLLWLQRDYVFRRFEKVPAQPGVEDDTPYDFDHICAASHWHGWQGNQVGKLTQFHAEKKIKEADEEGHWRIGNAIGNVRVWDSSDNRSDGDTAPSIKLKLTDAGGNHDVLLDSAITFGPNDDLKDELQAWKDCSPDLEKSGEPKFWTEPRALAFQRAIELRTFNLYQRFYSDLKFGDLAEQTTER